MKNKFFCITAIIATIAFASLACGGGDSSGSGMAPLTTIDDIEAYLADKTGTVDLSVKIDLGNMTDVNGNWRKLLTTINNAGVNINLDLSACTIPKITVPGLGDFYVFDPDYTVSTGKNKIESLVLPNTTQGMEEGTTSNPTFKHFSSLKSVEGSDIIVSDYAFYGLDALATANFPKAIITGDYAFGNCTALTTVNVPKVTFFSAHTFDGCSNLTTVNLPSVTSSPNSANMFISEGPLIEGMVIEHDTFNGCTNLTQISLPIGLTTIHPSVFESSGLTSITLPATVDHIRDDALKNCTSLVTVTCLATTPPALDSNAFSGTTIGQIKVPASSVEAYKSAANWSTYSDKISAL